MPYLQLNDRQVQLRIGATRIGAGAEVEFRIPALRSGAAVQAIVDLGRESHVAIRRAAPDAVVRVNGVQLGAEPTPLIHGDKIEIGGTELYYGDDRKGGSTQFIASTNLPDLGRLRGPLPTRATAATGGRVISLVDGREYMVAAGGLVLGRDASCDVVIPSSEVSRRHAEIVAGDNGYVVTDTSTNGLFVNGDRVEGMQILGRGDIVRIGPEEFRFYADTLAGAAAVAAPLRPPFGPTSPPPEASAVAEAPPAAPVSRPAPAAPAPVAPAPAAPAPAAPAAAAPAFAPPAAQSTTPPSPSVPPPPLRPPPAPPLAPPPAPPPAPLQGTASAAAAQAPAAPPTPPVAQPNAPPPQAQLSEAPAPSPAPPAGPPLPRGTIATLEVIGGGLLRGQRYAITTVLAHVGRGEHNDVVVAEESVSDSHAKFQRRDGVWYVIDLGSTNGTYVAGRRIEAEERLNPTADVRLGGVKLAFVAMAVEPSTEPRDATREFSALVASEAARRGQPAVGDRPAQPVASPRPRAPARDAPPPFRARTPERNRGKLWGWVVVSLAVLAAVALYFLKGR